MGNPQEQAFSPSYLNQNFNQFSNANITNVHMQNEFDTRQNMGNMADKIDYISKIKRISAKDDLVKSNSAINEFLVRCNKVVLAKCKVNQTEPIRIRKPYKLFKHDWFCANCFNINYN
jgi:hypothetical protein